MTLSIELRNAIFAAATRRTVSLPNREPDRLAQGEPRPSFRVIEPGQSYLPQGLKFFRERNSWHILRNGIPYELITENKEIYQTDGNGHRRAHIETLRTT